LVLKPLQFSASIAVGSIGSSIAIIELALRFSFTCVSCIGFGTSLIAEKLESTNLSRKILGNQEFKIQEFQDSTLKTINNLAKNNYTGKKIYSYFLLLSLKSKLFLCVIILYSTKKIVIC